METLLQPSPLLATTMKELSRSALPSLYPSQNPEAAKAVAEEDVPCIDISLLTGGTPEQRSQVVRDLGRACEEWGAFMVVNHGVPESLRSAVLASIEGFFDLTEEEKREYTGKHVMDPIRCGTGFNPAVEEVFRFWRDYLRLVVHPEFHSPAKPSGLREIIQEYTTYTRQMARELLNGIWESLGLEKNSMNGSLDLDICYQIFAANLYPPCPQPELSLGLPAHSDYGLLTMLFENGINGLQVKHNGEWINIKPIPNSFFINLGDHMEIVSNGRFKTLLHRAVVNSQSTRVSVVTAIGPSIETVVVPAPELVCQDPMGYKYCGMKYKDYVQYLLENKLKEKLVLDLTKVPKE